MGTAIPVMVFRGNWEVGSESPACLKLLTWLRMAGIDYEAVPLRGPPRSQTGKAPYIVRPDGTLLDDSSVIITTLTQERSIELDSHRSDRERALMTTIQRTVESHLYFALVLERWRDNFEDTYRGYFRGHLPEPMPWILGTSLRRQILRQAKAQGLGRRPAEQVEAEVIEDLDALASILGDGSFFFGTPGVTDAIVFGTLENARKAPIDGAIQRHLAAKSVWATYLDRMHDLYWR